MPTVDNLRKRWLKMGVLDKNYVFMIENLTFEIVKSYCSNKKAY